MDIVTVSNHALPSERLSIAPLVPRSRYSVRVTAHNNAGSTVHVYNFTGPGPLGVDGKRSASCACHEFYVCSRKY